MFLRTASDAVAPGTITVEDVIGKQPKPGNNVELDAALSEMDALIGQNTVKEAIMKIVKQAEVNWEREKNDMRVADIGLNRLFLGTPGTGKTTVAKIYGKILRALRLLSNGELLSKTASDFVGDVVGASQSRTRALVEAAQGKVLLIDEAYVLDDNL
jgi:AAA+ superfamily predicted ATPase